MTEKDLKKSNIVYYIDTIEKDRKTKNTQVRGWAFNLNTLKPVDIYLLGKNAEGLSLKRHHREDVNVLHEIPMDSKVGFTVNFDGIAYGKKVMIKLKNEEDEIIIKLDLKKNYDRLKEIQNSNPQEFAKQKIRSGIKFLKGVKKNGISYTYGRRVLEKKYYGQDDYSYWIDIYENYNEKRVKNEIAKFKRNPKISIVMPVYNVEERWIEACIDSVINQYYENWELCIADDCSSDPHIKPLLNSYMERDKRIKVVFRKENGHISEATNSALEIATGEYVGLLDNDDELSVFALYEVVKLLNTHPEADLIYTDEDKLSESNHRSQPFFKTDWAPDSLMTNNYICHFGVYRKKILNEIGGFRKGYEGSQDYDLVLRFTEKTKEIFHIPKILYHWRMIGNSTAVNPDSKGYAFEAGKRALEDALKRRGLEGTVSHGAFSGAYDIDYNIKSPGLVSIIIPTKDHLEDLKVCIDSIFEKTEYEDFEILIADNGSVEEKTKIFLEAYSEKYKEKFRVLSIDIPFNYSRINNLAVKEAKGDYLLFLNNDTKVITQGWLKKMVSYAQQDHIGAVGAKLYYPEDRIQHAGVLMGMGGIAGHGHLNYPKENYGYFGKLMINSNYSAVTAACMMVKRKDFDLVNGFEETLRVAFNDVDFCLKLYKNGKYNIWLHNVELYHYESKTRGFEDTEEKKQRFKKEIKYMETHWSRYIKEDPFYNVNLTRVSGNYGVCVDIDRFLRKQN